MLNILKILRTVFNIRLFTFVPRKAPWQKLSESIFSVFWKLPKGSEKAREHGDIYIYG